MADRSHVRVVFSVPETWILNATSDVMGILKILLMPSGLPFSWERNGALRTARGGTTHYYRLTAEADVDMNYVLPTFFAQLKATVEKLEGVWEHFVVDGRSLLIMPRKKLVE